MTRSNLAKVATLRNDLAEASAELEQRRGGPSASEHEVLKRRLQDYEQKLSLRLSELEDLRRQRNEYEEAIAALDAANADLQAQVEGLTTARDEAHCAASELESQLEQAHEELTALSGPGSSHLRIRDLEASLYRCQQQLTAVQAQVEEADAARTRLEAELQEREEELMGAEGKIAVLRKEVHRLMSTSPDKSHEL